MDRYHTIQCDNCKALINSDAQTCPFCGASNNYKVTRTLGISWVNAQPVVKILIYFQSAVFLLCFIPGFFNPSMGISSGFFSPSSRVLYYLGTAVPNSLHVDQWRLIAATFLHGSLMHIFFNMFWLKDVGPYVVRIYRAEGFLFIYFLSGIIGNIVAVAFEGPVVGASGAIFGLIGVLIAFGKKSNSFAAAQLSKTLWIFSIIMIGIGFILPFVSNGAHIAGLVTGLFIGFVFDPNKLIFRTASIISFPILIAVVGVTLYQMFMSFLRIL